MNIKIVIIVSLVALCQSRFIPANAELDAKMQEGRLLRCWEEKHPGFPSLGFQLSEPQFHLCGYYSDFRDYDKFVVGGVEMDSDDYSLVMKMLGGSMESFAMLNVCLQEAFSFKGPQAPSSVSFRCLCQRDACNLPAPLTDFLDFNSDVIPVPE